MTRCVFINLAAAAERRGAVEASFAAAAPAGWSLERFEALTPSDVAAVPGGLKPAEKACFASHRAALAADLDSAGHLMIAEDDVVFSPRTFAALDQLLAQAPDWDVLFTDVAFCDLALMVHLARRRDPMAAAGEQMILNLRGRAWNGATAYLVRGSAKARLHAALAAATAMDRPYDLFLRDLCEAGELKAGVCFPFLTTVSAAADASQIQSGPDVVFDQTLSAFRRLMFVERDLDQCRADTQRLRTLSGGEAADMVGTVFATLVSPAFPLDR